MFSKMTKKNQNNIEGFYTNLFLQLNIELENEYYFYSSYKFINNKLVELNILDKEDIKYFVQRLNNNFWYLINKILQKKNEAISLFKVLDQYYLYKMYKINAKIKISKDKEKQAVKEFKKIVDEDEDYICDLEYLDDNYNKVDNLNDLFKLLCFDAHNYKVKRTNDGFTKITSVFCGNYYLYIFLNAFYDVIEKYCDKGSYIHYVTNNNSIYNNWVYKYNNDILTYDINYFIDEIKNEFNVDFNNDYFKQNIDHILKDIVDLKILSKKDILNFNKKINYTYPRYTVRETYGWNLVEKMLKKSKEAYDYFNGLNK